MCSTKIIGDVSASPQWPDQGEHGELLLEYAEQFGKACLKKTSGTLRQKESLKNVLRSTWSAKHVKDKRISKAVQYSDFRELL